MIDALRKYNEKYNKDVGNRLLLEVNVKSNEYDLLRDSLFFNEHKIELQEELSDAIKSAHKKNIDTKDLELVWKTFDVKLDSINSLINEISNLSNEIEKKSDRNDYTAYRLRKQAYFLERTKSFISSQIITVNGDGATGKTHMLTRLCNDMLDENKPVIIFYGHMISKIDFFMEKINQIFKSDSFIKDIEQYGKSIQSDAVIIYDALNETRTEEKVYIIDKLIEIIQGTNIKLVISYRNGDLEQEAEEFLNGFPSISLFGFNDYMEAAIKFAEYFKVDINEILEIDFNNNPLMLIVFCENYKNGKKDKGLRGTKAATYYYESYFKEIIRKIFKEKSIKKKDGSVFAQIKIWNIIAKDAARLMVNNFRNYITVNEFLGIIDSCGLNVASTSLINYLTIHNLFERFINYENEEVCYKFSFQKISDFLIVRYLMNEKNKSQTWKDYFLEPQIVRYLNRYRTILETLVEEVPLRNDSQEIFEVIDTKVFNNFVNIYLRGLKYRSANSIGKDIENKQKLIKEYLRENESDVDLKLWYELILSVMVVPFHPFNYHFYTTKLYLSMKNNERDLFLYRFEKEYYEYGERLLSVLKIPYYSDINNLGVGFSVNLSEVYFWLLSVSNRELRDKATKALSAVLYKNFDIFGNLAHIVSKVDDQYIVERFLAASYSAITINKNYEQIKTLYDFCNETLLKNKTSNIRIKHYLRLIISLARKMGVIDKDRELLKSTLELTTYDPNEFESLAKDGLEYSNVYTSLFNGFGDFSSYIIKPYLTYFEYINIEFKEKIDLEYKDFYDTLKEEKEIIDEAVKSRPSYELLNKLSGNTRKQYDFFARQLNSIKDKRISIDTLSSTILKKMIDLGYGKDVEYIDQKYSYYFRSQSRHDHRNERLGKKYQWIAYFELLGECFDNLKF